MKPETRNPFDRHPPATPWLEKELRVCRKALPGVQLHVLFADDLPHCDELLHLSAIALRHNNRLGEKNLARYRNIRQARQQALADCLAVRIGDPEVAATLVLNAISLRPALESSFCTSDARLVPEALHNNCGELTRMTPASRPAQAFIMLAARCFDSISHNAYSTGLSVRECEHENPHIPHILSLHHERGHLETALRGTPVTPWTNEFGADRTAAHRCAQLKRPDLTERALLTRAAFNFVGDISQEDSAYWNVLCQAGALAYTADGILRDKSALLELKLRAASQLKSATLPVHGPASEIGRLTGILTDKAYAGVRHIYSSNQPNFAQDRKALLHALDRVVEEDVYTYPETRLLAQITQAATHRLFPVVMAEKRKYLPHLHKGAGRRAPAA